MHFLVIFHQEVGIFIIFISFFDKVSKFPQQDINQSETGIGDKKLSVEFYVKVFTEQGKKRDQRNRNGHTDVFCQKNVSRKIHRKTPLLESLFIYFLESESN